MVILDCRSRDILLILLKSAEIIPTRELAARLGVSARMVRYRLETIESWLGSRKIDLKQQPNQGVWVEASAGEKKALIQEISELEGYSLVLSREERMRMLLLKFLLARNPLTASDLAQDLEVSRSTLYKDLVDVEQWLMDFELRIDRKSRVGLMLNVSEYLRRLVLEEYVIDLLGNAAFLDLHSGLDRYMENKLKGKVGLRRELCSWLERFDLVYARKALKILQGDLGYQFTDNAYSSLAFQIALQVDCIKNDRTLDLPADLLGDIREIPVFPMARKVLETYSGLSAEAVRESEVGYLSVLIQCAPRRYTVSSIMESQDQFDIDPDLEEIVSSIMSTAATYLHPALQRDKILAQALCYHLRTALCKLKYEIPIRNPNLAESQQKYPYIHKVARISCVFLSSKIGRIIPEEEIGKITMHLAAAVERLRIDSKIKKKVIVICGEGISTAWLVVSRLNAKFPEIEIMEIMSVREVSEMRSFPGEMDGMISTVPLEIPGIPVIEVSPLLNDQDQISIKEGLRMGQRYPSEPVDKMLGRSLKQFLQNNLISTGVIADSWQDVVRAAGSLLVSARTVEERYVDAMITAVEIHGPYVVVFPGIALLHARPDEGVLQPSLSLITLQKPVNFGHPEHDPVDIVFALSAEDDTSHTGMLLELIDALRSPDIVKKIRSAQDTREVLAAFEI